MNKPEMATAVVHQSVFSFLNELEENNNRQWFEIHRQEYEFAAEAIGQFAQGLLDMLNGTDVIETPSGRKSLYRIYRDVRFSKDKSPYKTHWSGRFKRAGKFRRGGYYFHFAPGNSRIAGGFFGPDAADLKLIRDDIAFDDKPIRAIIADPGFAAMFGGLQGEKLKTTPKGFAADHPAADILRYKQFLLIRRFTDEEVLHPGFLYEAARIYRQMRPFFDYMSEVLSSDPNGAG